MTVQFDGNVLVAITFQRPSRAPVGDVSSPSIGDWLPCTLTSPISSRRDEGTPRPPARWTCGSVEVGEDSSA